MESLKEYFNNWIIRKTDYQICEVDRICQEVDIDPTIWFNNHFIKNFGDFTDTDVLDEILSTFIYHIENKFSQYLLKYMPPDGLNIFNEPYISIDMDLKHKKSKLSIDKKGRKKFRKKISNLTLNQKVELMKENKLFSYIVTQTNLEIFSKREIRVLKLRNLNDVSTNI